jgi:predicted DsbA family dithiol-disulfide isomerase
MKVTLKIMKVEIWSDVVCPFCYIGKRNFEEALSSFQHSDKIEVIWKSYQLDPTIPENVNDSYVGYLSKKRNVSEAQGNEMLASVTASAKKIGLDYDFEKSVMTNSYKAHLLIQFAKSKGLGNEIEERLFKAFLTDGDNISDISTLTKLGKEVGLIESEIQAAFTDRTYAEAVRNDLYEAKQIRVTGVPFFVFDRKFAVSGAQPSEVFLDTIKRVFGEWNKNPDFEIANVESCSIDGQCE